MTVSRAETVAAALVREWRLLARVCGQPSAGVIRTARETVLSLVAQDLLSGVLSGLAVNDTHGERLLIAHRWSFSPVRPYLRPAWPVTQAGGSDARFVLRFERAQAWIALPNDLQREIAGVLPCDFAVMSAGFTLTSRLVPVQAQRLPGGDYLVLETLPMPAGPQVANDDRDQR